MKKRRLAACAAVALVAFLGGPIVGTASAQEAVYLVRHAERASDEKNSLLSAEGHARAARLADLLRDAGITHIFISEYLRTAETAAPLAARLGITPTVVPADDPAALLARIQAAGPAARVLVAGHSDTVPNAIKALGCPQDITIAKGEFDDLFVVIPRGKTAPLLIRLKY
jgi:broad specificity phosphatase PhoE